MKSYALEINSFFYLETERDAGFYTTRFGRSDPMMRLREVQTRFVPEQVGQVQYFCFLSKDLSIGTTFE